MTDLPRPDRATLEQWLRDIHIDNHLCGDCEGLHIATLQAVDGVVNSRIFLQRDHLLFTTELELRPMAILPVASELGRLNIDYSCLKVFLDVVDDETPQLVIAATVLTGAGIAHTQFAGFVARVIESTRLLAEECLQLDYLFAEPAARRTRGSRLVH